MTELTTVELSLREFEGYLSQEQLGLEGTMLEPIYYRQFGLRRAVQLVAPTLRPIAQLEMPRQSILHHLPMDETLYGIEQDDPLLAKERRMVAVDHVLKLTSDKGPPRPRPVPIMGLVRDYHRKNRRTRRVLNIDTVLRDPVTPLVVNYGLLPHVYYYTKTYLASYNKWYNLQVTQLDTIVQRLHETKRTQYLPCYLPTHLPSLQQLTRGSRGINRSVLNLFNEPSSLFILEMWKWLGEERETSLLSRFPEDKLDRINFIWIESGHWFVMNLGLLNSWRKSEKNPKAFINPMQMQRRFLRLLMYLFETRTVHTDEVPVSTPEAPIAQAEPTSPASGMDNQYIDTVKAEPVKIKVETEKGSKTLKLQSGLNVDILPEDVHVEETDSNIEIIDKAILRDLEVLDRMYEQREQVAQTVSEDDNTPIEVVEREKPAASDDVEKIQYAPKERTLESGIMDPANQYADQGLLSAAEYRRMQALSEAYKKLPDPYGRKQTLAEAAKLNVEDLKIRKDIKVPDASTIFDKSMLSSTLSDFTSRYVTDILPTDIARSVLAIQHAGVAVTGYTVEDVEDAMGHYENHAVQLTPVRGKPSTIHFRLPKVKADGTFTSNGVRQRMRLQRIDLPIRKLSPSKVALTSYFSKTFVNRSEKKVHDYTGWLTNQIAARGLDPDDQSISDIMLADVFDSYQVVPRIYSALAQRFRSFKSGEYEFFFDYHERHAHFGQEWVNAAEREGWTVIGRHKKKPIVVDRADALYVIDGDNIQELGKMETLVGLQGKSPLEVTEVKILNKQLPLGVILAYLLGLDRLIEVTNATPRRVPTGERLSLADHEFAVRFEDEALVFSRDNRIATMLFAGFNVYEQSIRNYASHLFNRKDIYQNILEQNRIGPRYLREADLMQELFVDPITQTILEQMKEPTDLIGLLLRSCELLMTDWSPSETDMRYMRIRGYERLAGTVYSEMVRSIRGQRSRGSVANAKIEMAPYTVWQAITQDSANKLVEESNPIHNLKEKEEVTYSGSGGRSSRSMVKRTRVFHENDMGVISEATKDSGDVAITTFLTMDPNLVDLYGRIKPFDPKDDGAASMVSTSALISPAADRDDGKRVNFISIQLSSSTFTKGYVPSPLRTGAEQVIAHRTDDLFAATAKGPGKVEQVTDRAVVVIYESGEKVSYEIGRRFGTVAGQIFPHQIQTALKPGDTLAEGDCIVYNSHYFALDPFNPRQAILKTGVLATTALMDTPDTLEDSSAISQSTAEKLGTDVTYIRDIVLSFDQTIHNLVNVGDVLDSEDILCTIEDAVTAQNNLFDENSLDTLRLIAANTPRAKHKGRVERIEVFYHGDLDDISPDLQELAMRSDRERQRVARALGRKYTSGRVDESLRLNGNPLPYDHLAIRVYITSAVGTGSGDKGVFGNQLKTIFRRVFTGRHETESGTPIDAIFGYTSINARIVDSPLIMGTTNTLLKVLSQRMYDAYKKEKK